MSDDPQRETAAASEQSGAEPATSSHSPHPVSRLIGAVPLLIAAAFLTWALMRTFASPPQATLAWFASDPVETVTVESDQSEVVLVGGPADGGTEPVVAQPAALAGRDLTAAAWDAFAARDAIKKGPVLDDIVPVERRWVFEFEAGLTQGPYARRIDALQLELGVMSDGNTIDYVSKISEAKATHRKGNIDQERRMYLTWRRGDLIRADEVFLERAGVNANGKIVLHFIPEETRAQMQNLELEHANRDPAQILQTVFAVKRTFRGYELYVKDQIGR